MADKWACGACGYKWAVSVVADTEHKALPVTAACPRCGEEVKALADALRAQEG